MAKMGSFSADGLKKLQKQLNGLQREQTEEMLAGCAKELAARLLEKVIGRTPVGTYSPGSGKTGGTLRRGWTAGAGAAARMDSLEIRHEGSTFTVEIVNPVSYASYVEFGHRTSNRRGWVKGRFMLTISEQELREIAPRVLEARIRRFLGGIMT